MIVFRALGYVLDRAILELICYYFSDKQMLGLLRPSLDKARFIQSTESALDYIGRRGTGKISGVYSFFCTVSTWNLKLEANHRIIN